MKIAISIDIDWAPDEVIDYTCELLEKSGLKATLFATHKSTLITELARNINYEICPHPNYYSLFGKEKTMNFLEITDQIMQDFPNARGIRTHGLITGFPLLHYYHKIGLKYDASMYLHEQYNVKPFKIFNDFYRIPHSFEDDVHFSINKKFDMDLTQIDTDILIMDFHPIHVFLNTASVNQYEKAKKYYKNPKELQKLRNKELGICTLLKSILDQSRALDLESVKFIDLI